MHGLPPYVASYVCDLFWWANMNANMHFEAVCFFQFHYAIEKPC